jgi:hypothetical protein
MHLYVFLMNSNRPRGDIDAIELYRITAGEGQVWAADKLGITQPYYSKLVRGLVPISAKIAHKARGIAQALVSSSGRPSNELEDAVVAALRSSELFRALAEVGLRMHKKE